MIISDDQSQLLHTEVKALVGAASYQTWLASIRFEGVKGNALHICVANEDVGDKVNAIADELVVMWNSQQPEHPISRVSCIVGGDAAPDDVLHMQVSRTSIHNAITQPERIVVVPKYLLRWSAWLSPILFFLVIAFRQTAFLKLHSSKPAAFTCRCDEITPWCGVSPASFWRLLQSPELTLFVKKLDDKNAANGRATNTYQLTADLPLTPQDASWLAQVLRDGGIRVDPLQALLQLQDADLRLPAVKQCTATGGQPSSVWGVVCQLVDLHQYDPVYLAQLESLCDQLQQKITQPAQMTSISWYFLQHWLPRLGHGPALLVVWLRSQGYFNGITGELRDVITIEGGYKALADQLGLKSLTTLYTWLPGEAGSRQLTDAPTEKTIQERAQKELCRTLLQAFIHMEDNAQAAKNKVLRMRIKLDGDPLVPDDVQVYADVQKIISQPHYRFESASMDATTDLRVETGDYYRFESPCPEATTDLRVQTQANYRIESQKPAITTDLRVLKVLNTLNTLTQLNTNGLNTTTPEGGGWQLDQLLVHNRVSPDSQKSLLRLGCSAANWVSWVLYAVSASGQGIKDPVGFAIARLIKDPQRGAGGDYDQLATLGSAELTRLMARGINGFSGSAAWDAYARQLDGRGLQQLKQIMGLKGEESHE